MPGLSRRCYDAVNLSDCHLAVSSLARALANGFKRKLSARLPDSGGGFIERRAFYRDEQRYRLSLAVSSACGSREMALRSSLASPRRSSVVNIFISQQ